MKIAVISTGTELLRGSTVNTNLSFLGQELSARGMEIAFEVAAGDTAGDLANALAWTLERCRAVVVTGGLGPTSDDITLETASRFAGLELVKDPALVKKVEEFWEKLHRGHCPKEQFKQALVPDGGRIIDNPCGSASGIAFDFRYAGGERTVFLAPGPPAEFEPMARNFIAPELEELNDCRTSVAGFLAAGMGESFVSRIAEKVVTDAGLSLAYTAKPDGTRFYLSGTDAERVARGVEEVRNAIGECALTAGSFRIEEYIASELAKRRMTLATAESCTGGMIGELLTTVSGVSQVYQGGIVAYDNRIKREILGVAAETLDAYGAVSPQTAGEMALGAAKVLGTDCAVATTGVAGPTGGTPEKPVGLVYVAACCRGAVEVEEWRFRGNRQSVRERAAAKALLLLRKVLK